MTFNEPPEGPGQDQPGEAWPPPPGGAYQAPAPPPAAHEQPPYPPPGPQPGHPPVPGAYGPGYPPPGGGYAPSGYAPPGYPPGYQVQVEHPQGTTILVLGILSLVISCPLVVLGPVAWIMGSNALKEIDARPGYYSNRGNVQAGRIIGIVATVLLILGIVFWVGVFVLGTFSTTSSGY